MLCLWSAIEEAYIFHHGTYYTAFLDPTSSLDYSVHEFTHQPQFFILKMEKASLEPWR